LLNNAKRAADYAPPIYDQPDPLASPKKPKRAPNKKSDESIAELKKFFKEKTHPLPDKAPIRIFFADIPSYRALYKHYKKDHPKGTAHYFCRASWNYYRRVRFPWVKVSIYRAVIILNFRNSRRRRPHVTPAVSFGLRKTNTENGRATPKISRRKMLKPRLKVLSCYALCSFYSLEYKAKKVLWEIHREHADTEYKTYMHAKEASIQVSYFCLYLPSLTIRGKLTIL
jgi:hypothetical protein